MAQISPDKNDLRKFSVTMFVALAIIGTFLIFRHKESYVWFYSAGSLLLLTGIFAAGVLKPVYILWMKLALMLSWINTRLILLVIFYLIFTPVGLIIRLFKIDLLDKRIEKARDSYWKKGEGKEFLLQGYERQF